MYQAIFVGGGPAGLAPLVWAARQGTLRRLALKGLVVVERAGAIGAGTIGHHAISSDTLAETFLECLEDGAEPRLNALRKHPTAIAVSAHRGGPVPLPKVAAFLETLGAAMSNIIVSAGGHVLTRAEALQSSRRADGGWQTKVITTNGESDLVSHNLILATGGKQTRENLHILPIAGRPLLPRFTEKLMLSREILAPSGVAEVSRRLGGNATPKVAIVGGSHSALAAANVLLNRCKAVVFGSGAITLLHRRPLRVFYPSAASAVADGYNDFDTKDICPISHRLFRLGGFRLEARDLLLRALEIGERAPEPRLRLCQIATSAADLAEGVLTQADLVIAALGYKPNALPLFDINGNEISLAKAPAPLVDRQCRVLDINDRSIPGVFGLGLAAGFVPNGALGGEPSFHGQTNGIWLWQNGVGAIIVDALLSNKTTDVNISAIA